MHAESVGGADRREFNGGQLKRFVRTGHPEGAKEIFGISASDIVYSFCTLVTDPSEYKLMVTAFLAKGFHTSDCEFLYIDNSDSNIFDAYAGYNIFLQVARGKHLILCHQDILPIDDDRARLDHLLEELNRRDPNWGLCGNAGNTPSTRAVRISDPWGSDQRVGGPFPIRVTSLDENFIVVRRDANLALSHDLRGFHWYGSDLCIVADILGWNAYVIDFHLQHKSGGNPDNQFVAIRERLRVKYRRAFRSRWIHGTVQSIFISASPTRSFIARARVSTLRRLNSLISCCRRFPQADR